MTRPIIIAIDVEPDGRGDVGDRTCEGIAVSIRELGRLRSALEENTGAPVRFNWFFRFDPQVQSTWGRVDWVKEACPNLVDWTQKNGDLLGIHSHFWRWDEKRDRWFNDFADAAWREHCLRTCIEGYEGAFQARPIASRCGDRWFSNDLVPLLRREGIRYDLTIEPGAPDQPVHDDPYATAWLPDYREAPRRPYRPSESDFLMAKTESAVSDDDLWMLPVTTTRPARWAPVRRFPYAMKVSRPLNMVLRPTTVWHCLKIELSCDDDAPLVLVLRSGDLAQPHFLANFRYIAERLTKHPGMRGRRFSRIDDAMTSVVGTRGAAAR